jgi:hypothetical protein
MRVSSPGANEIDWDANGTSKEAAATATRVNKAGRCMLDRL